MIPKKFLTIAEYAEGRSLTYRPVIEWVKLGYIRQTIKERKAAVLELRAEGLSSREIGEVIGVDHKTVLNDMAGENSPSIEIAPLETLTEAGEFPNRPCRQ